MTFLELCQALRREVGAPGEGPSNVESQTGEYERLVNWIRNEWVRIQQRHLRWRFLWAQGSVELTDEFTEFSLPSDLAVLNPDFIYIGKTPVNIVTWPEFQSASHGTTYPMGGRIAAISPDGMLHFQAPPPADSLMKFEYWKTPQVLRTNTDVPVCPSQYQYVIVYAAMIQYGLYENAPEVVEQGRYSFDRVYQEMVNRELPDVQMAGPLA
ncbi:phage adaptor protein [Spiribacter onubensis]|uniref:Head-to-tail adaptor n=1 Tax=Spiribacter onubensis TaxID=3122420 RepID=A0ABV3S6W6_9GAMM